MLNLNNRQRIFLCRSFTDMRKHFDTLAELVRSQLGADPFSGDVFVFIGKRQDRLKILVWEVSGFWVLARRLEQGRFAVRQRLADTPTTGTIALSAAEMHLLLEGIDVHRATYHQHYHR